MYFIEGLANGRIAVLGKIHHALADGVASANLLARGMDLQQSPQADRDSYATRSRRRPRAKLVRTAFADHMRQIGRLPGVMRYTAQGVSRVRKSSRKLSPELTRPFTPPPSFMNHRVDGQRKFATATLALADVKETGKHLGVTINDMVLAISAGALRKLSLEYDGHADHPLLASVPVSFDFSQDRISGNRFSGVMMVVPIELEDPLERVQAVHDAAVDAKESPPPARARNSSAGGRRTSRPHPRSGCSTGWRTRTARTRCSTFRSRTCRARASPAVSAAHW